jgi:hypothetical protein
MINSRKIQCNTCGWHKNSHRVLRAGDSLESLGINEERLLKCIIKKQDELRWNGLVWFRTETGGWLL